MQHFLKPNEWKSELKNPGEKTARWLQALYGENTAEKTQRIVHLLDRFVTLYGQERDVCILSVPGRSELAGNHTDHNLGCVIAGSIDLDMIMIAAKREDGAVSLESVGYPAFTVEPAAMKAPDPSRYGTTDSLIAGMENGFVQNGFAVGGMDAVAASDVLPGSGLSSSAAFEVMVGYALNVLYNAATIDAVTIAKIAQYAENEFFGKPCGLMDQCACAVGGVVAIDFADPKKPVVEKINFDLTGAGYALCILDTGGSHADLTAEYAAIPAEMKQVAAYFGKAQLRTTDEAQVRANIPALRAQCGDRAVLRALHFFAENRRVSEMKQAIKENRTEAWFDGVNASGRSSLAYLQNVFAVINPREQGITLSLCLAETMGAKAWRVHGGGFAGTMQAYVPLAAVDAYKKGTEAVFGEGHCHVLHIRPLGATCLEI